ncbi:MAG: hypothetical protein EPO57_02620 [Chitinophagaceae bacterium]|nr:MAG: hypothetical protein EPO57_02620 [Chitinophagaceae bacterium]
MKKLFVLFAVAAVMTACNNAAETAPAVEAPAVEAAPAVVDTTAAPAPAAEAAAPAAETK